MPWSIKISASAKKDITDIKNWYKEQSVLAAKNFIFELTEAIDSLQKEIKEHKPVFKKYRRLLLKRFPYVIYYNRLPDDHITEIIAVLHTKRDRPFVKKRLPE
jgi:plasmid stabilization system protein ParE